MDTSLYNFEITLKIETTLNEILLRLTFDLDGVARNQNFSLKKYIFQKTLFKDFKAMILSALSHLFVFGPEYVLLDRIATKIINFLVVSQFKMEQECL